MTPLLLEGEFLCAAGHVGHTPKEVRFRLADGTVACCYFCWLKLSGEIQGDTPMYLPIDYEPLRKAS